VTVAAVQEELEAGAETHLYIEHALAMLGDRIPVLTPSSSAEKVEEKLLETLDPGKHKRWQSQRLLTARLSLMMAMRVRQQTNGEWG